MKLNYYTLTLNSWDALAMLVLILDPWLFQIAGKASPTRSSSEEDPPMELPSKPEILIGVVDLDAEDLEVFLPPHVWDDVKDSFKKVGPPQRGC